MRYVGDTQNIYHNVSKPRTASLAIKNERSLKISIHTLLFILQMTFSDQSLENSEKIIATTKTAIHEEQEVFDKPYTLEAFSIDHFMTPAKRTLSRTLQSQSKRKEKYIPWSFTKVNNL